MDDEPGVRMLVTEVLEELGYSALEAHDGPSALRLMPSNFHIDMLVTDVGLLSGLNGPPIGRRQQQAGPSMKVLFITRYAENAAIGSGYLTPSMAVVMNPTRSTPWLTESKP